MGHSGADWTWGVTTNLKYKNWNFRVSMDGRAGGLISSYTQAYMWYNGQHPNSVTEARYKDATEGGKNYIGEGVKVVSGTVKYDSWGAILEDTRQYASNDVAVTYKQYIQTMHKGFAWGGTASPLDVLDATFMKVREASVTYDVPRSICEKIKAKHIAVSVIGNNLLMWAKDFKYSDPDGGYENLSNPSQRSIGFNVQVNF